MEYLVMDIMGQTRAIIINQQTEDAPHCTKRSKTLSQTLSYFSVQRIVELFFFLICRERRRREGQRSELAFPTRSTVVRSSSPVSCVCPVHLFPPPQFACLHTKFSSSSVLKSASVASTPAFVLQELASPLGRFYC